MPKLFLDTETYSDIPINNGTHAYAENVEVIMWQYAIDDGPVLVENYLTDSLKVLLRDPQYEIVIHNSSFDRTVIRHAEKIDLPIDRIFDTMACALAHSLPGSLDQLCETLGIAKDKAKDKGGKRLVSLFCKPQKKRGHADYRVTKESHPAEWEAFREYGRLDIEAMRAVYKKLPRWNFKGIERKIWELDQRINDRGVYVDLDLANAAILACAKAKHHYDIETLAKTAGEVTAVTRRDALLDHIQSRYGEKLPDLTAARVKHLLDDGELPKGLLDLLHIRLEASKTSVSKYKRVINGVSKDGRLRGLLQFCGASRTGRWSGRLFQPQNLARPTLDTAELEIGIKALKSGHPLSNVMEVCSSAIRGVIISPPGRKLVIADLSNIEGRVLAWLAFENWKVKAFSDFDQGIGHDLYLLTYAKAFGIPPAEVSSDQRQIGKVMELAFGYQGGLGAWVTFATAFAIDLDAMAEQAYDTIPVRILRQAEEFRLWYKKQGKGQYGLSNKTFVVCDSFKRMWREEHANVVAYWKELEAACVFAIQNKGTKVSVRRHNVACEGSWLRISLPSGRCLCYPCPRLIDDKITYMGLDPFTHKWTRIATYGGKIAENITQATARDILAHTLLEIDAAGYEIALTVHDEGIAEVPDSPNFSADGLCELMATKHYWAAGLPLVAKGSEAYRYGKG